MKSFNIIALLIVFITACNESQNISSQTDEEIKSSINQIMDDWHKAAAQADYQAYMNAMDSSSIFIGTDATENWNKQQFEKFSKPIFDKGKAWDFDVLKRNIYISNSKDVIWFDEILNTWMGVCRGSGVLQIIDNNWKIEHYVLSVDIPNDDIQEVIKAKKQNDSLLIQQYNVTPK